MFGKIMKIIGALAAAAAAVYVVATYGDRIVAWAKRLCPCASCEEPDAQTEVIPEAPAEEAAEETVEAPVEESAEAPAEEVAAAGDEPVAEEADFEE